MLEQEAVAGTGVVDGVEAIESVGALVREVEGAQASDRGLGMRSLQDGVSEQQVLELVFGSFVEFLGLEQEGKELGSEFPNEFLCRLFRR